MLGLNPTSSWWQLKKMRVGSPDRTTHFPHFPTMGKGRTPPMERPTSSFPYIEGRLHTERRKKKGT